jgi:hypothetical protein
MRLTIEFLRFGTLPLWDSKSRRHVPRYCLFGGVRLSLERDLEANFSLVVTPTTATKNGNKTRIIPGSISQHNVGILRRSRPSECIHRLCKNIFPIGALTTKQYWPHHDVIYDPFLLTVVIELPSSFATSSYISSWNKDSFLIDRM